MECRCPKFYAADGYQHVAQLVGERHGMKAARVFPPAEWRPVGRLLVTIGLITAGPTAASARADLFVYSGVAGQVLRFDETTGAPRGPFAMTPGAQDLAFGPDRNLYVSSTVTQSVLRFDGATGASLGTFAPVAGPFALAFGPEGNLYVHSGVAGQILRFDGTTGAALGTFVPVGARDLAFGPDGDLYIASTQTQSNLRFDGSTGAALGTFVSVGGPFLLTFGGGTGVAVPTLEPAGLILLGVLIAAAALRLLRSA